MLGAACSMPLLYQHRRFRSEKEVAAKYLPSTQLILKNTGREGGKGVKRQNHRMMRMKTQAVLHQAPIGETWRRRQPVGSGFWKKWGACWGERSGGPGHEKAGKDE